MSTDFHPERRKCKRFGALFLVDVHLNVGADKIRSERLDVFRSLLPIENTPHEFARLDDPIRTNHHGNQLSG
jgi:hypothetical protein